MANPEYPDLLKDSSDLLGGNNDYFLITITDLDLNTTYPLEFRWKYADGTYGKDWSSVFNILTQGSTVPVEPELRIEDVVAIPGGIKITWTGKDESSNDLTNLDRVDIHIAGTSTGDGTKPSGFFKTAGTQTFNVEAGIYIVQLKAIRVDGTTSFFSSARTVTVPAIEELIEAPIAPTGFSARAILGGIEVTWNGTYAGGATWSGFEAINIYAGTSTSATPGTYIKVNQMTGNKTSNKVVVPIDGTYVRYGFPAYIHASSINKATPPVESTISANVANATPSQVVNTDIIDAAITEAKVALAAITEVKIDNNAITAAKIAANAVTETKIANDAITSPKIVAGAIEAGKIAAGAITAEKIAANAIEADKIAANAITAGKIAANAITAGNIVALAITGDKIAANTIGVGNLEANTISVTNLSAGDISATSYIRAGSAGSARVEIASSTVGSVLPGLTVYDSSGNQMLRAPLSGGLTVTGSLTATQISTSSGKFSVNTSGILSASDVTLTGTIKATSGFIGGENSGIYIASGAIQNDASGSQFKLDNTGKARFGSATGNAIVIDPTASNGGYYIYHTTGGQNGAESGVFSVSTAGNLKSTSGTIGGWTIGSTTLTGGSTTLNSNGTISGATITGGTVQTDSGNYATILNGSSNAIQFKVAGAISGNVLPLGTAGILMHYGSTPDSTGSTYPKVQLSFSTALLQGSSSYYVQSTNSGNSALGDFRMFNGLQVDGSATFNSTMFAPNLTVLSSGATMRVATGSIGEIREDAGSSIRYKENVVNIEEIDNLNPNKLLEIPVRAFKYKEDYLDSTDERFGTYVPGFIAEEMDEYYPIAVDHSENGAERWNDSYLMPGMLALIQNLNQELISIKSRLDALEG